MHNKKTTVGQFTVDEMMPAYLSRPNVSHPNANHQNVYEPKFFLPKERAPLYLKFALFSYLHI